MRWQDWKAGSEARTAAAPRAGPILSEAQPRLGDAVRKLGEERCDPSIELLDAWVQAGVAGKEETAGEHAQGREGVGRGDRLGSREGGHVPLPSPLRGGQISRGGRRSGPSGTPRTPLDA